MSNASSQEASIESQKTIMGHPQGLFIVFFAELWERFSFYGMRALLVLYMTKEFLFTDEKAFGVYAGFMSLMYATPIFGGLLADKVLGTRKTIVLGGVTIAIGNALMVVGNLEMFYAALALLVVGNGLFKANISSLVGSLYEKEDPRRDAGFTIFYMGINLGGFMSPFVIGYIGESYGWKYGFLIASIGMFAGLFTLLKGQKVLGNKGLPPKTVDLKQRCFGLTKEQFFSVLPILTVPAFYFVLLQTGIMNNFMNVAGIAVVILMLVLAFKSEGKERFGLLTILGLMFFHATFWSLLEQAGSSINLFTDRNIDKTLFGFIEIKTSLFQSVNPFFIFLLAPIFSYMWTKLEQNKKAPNAPMKFFFGVALAGVGFYTLALGTKYADEAGLTSMLWLVGGYFFLTVGELFVSPVGLSMVSQLAPKKLVSMIMGVWFLSISFAHHIAGLISKMMAVPTGDGSIDPLVSLPIYGEVFEKVSYGAFGIAVILLFLIPFLNKAFKEE